MKPLIRIVLVSLLLPLASYAQGEKEELIQDYTNLQLAKQYFEKQEYEKVLDYLDDLKDESRDEQVYHLLFDSYLELDELRKAEKLCKAWLRRIPGRQPNFRADLYFIYLEQEEPEDAQELLSEVEEEIARNPGLAYAYGKAFGDRGYPKRALGIYEAALERNPRMNFSYQKALLYGELGDIQNMYAMYLEMVEKSPGYLSTVKMLLARSIDAENPEDPNLQFLKKELIQKIQAGGPKHLNDLLIHIYSQEKNFGAAFTQLKALDRRGNLEGNEFSNLARLAFNSKDYRLAARINSYLIDKGSANPYYQAAVIAYLESNKRLLEEDPETSAEEWTSLVEDYEEYRKVFHGDPYQGELIRPMAEIKAYRLGEFKEAEDLLVSVFTKAYLGPEDQAHCQIAYADLLLFTGRRWDAIIYYRKAEKALERSPIGQEAKFKRAKAAYYVGDFEWSQGIFSVLKESTSKLIANDAMQYSLLITDNMALDSTTEALEAYAKADLYFYRELYDSSLALLELLDIGYSDHPIADESLLLRGKILARQGKSEQALQTWQKLVEEHGTDILADDALYAMAKLYQELYQDEQAMQTYEKLFTTYTDSFFASEARKAYRKLRGDQIN